MSGLLAAVFLDGDHEETAFYRAWAATADLVVAADGGARFLVDHGLTPDLVVGDFDSLDAAGAERLAAAGVELVRHPVRKDLTDGELAVEEARRRGALDHTLGHLAILRRLATAGVPARLVAPQLTVRVLAAPAWAGLDAPAGTRVSLVPLGDDATVTLSGLTYPLAAGTLPAAACLGLGNAVADGGAARIEVHQGVVAVVVADGAETFAGACRALPPAP